jgi:hypothetical protein
MKKQGEPPYQGVVDKGEAIGTIGSELGELCARWTVASYVSRIPSNKVQGVVSGGCSPLADLNPLQIAQGPR